MAECCTVLDLCKPTDPQSGARVARHKLLLTCELNVGQTGPCAQLLRAVNTKAAMND